MPTTRISEDTDLPAVFGELEDAQRATIVSRLTAADEQLSGLVDPLNERGGRNFARAWCSRPRYPARR